MSNRKKGGLLAGMTGLLSVVLLASAAIAQPPEVRPYDVNFTMSPPTIDGVVTAGEWDDAAAAADGWVLLRTAGTTADAENSRFRMTWDDDALYILFESDYGSWLSDISGQNPAPIDFGADSMNFYFNPDQDGDGNFPPGFGQTMPYNMPDGYQFAFNQYPGFRECGGDGVALTADDCSQDNRVNPTDSIAQGSTFGTFTEAHVDTQFGNQAQWAGMRLTHIAQTNGATGGVAELRIPWTEFDALADIDDGMGGLTPTGLNRTTRPNNNDEWFLQAGRISSDLNNNLPVWNWNSSNYFAETPHGALTFTGRPSSAPNGDFNNDGLWDCTDINALSNAIASGSSDLSFDMNQDGMITRDDITDPASGWLTAGGAAANNAAATGGNPFIDGDADLSGGVDGTDFNTWNGNKFSSNSNYCAGDFDASGGIDGSDFNTWNGNKFQSSTTSAVPEPATLLGLLLALTGVAMLRRS